MNYCLFFFFSKNHFVSFMQGRIEREATQYTQESQEKYGSLMDVQVYRGIPAETQK